MGNKKYTRKNELKQKSFKKKDDEYYQKELNDLKQEKRSLCSSISSDNYGEMDFKGDFKTNKEIKKIKQELKNKRRSIKRSQKQQWQKDIDDAIGN